jgi:hypothetical protein
MSGEVPIGATNPNQPSTTTPGSVSLIAGRSGKPWKRVAEVMQHRPEAHLHETATPNFCTKISLP